MFIAACLRKFSAIRETHLLVQILQGASERSRQPANTDVPACKMLREGRKASGCHHCIWRIDCAELRSITGVPACHIPRSSQLSPYADMNDHSEDSEPHLQYSGKLATLVTGAAPSHFSQGQESDLLAADRVPTVASHPGRLRCFSQQRKTGCSQPCQDCPSDSRETFQGNYNQAATQTAGQCVEDPLSNNQ